MKRKIGKIQPKLSTALKRIPADPKIVSPAPEVAPTPTGNKDGGTTPQTEASSKASNGSGLGAELNVFLTSINSLSKSLPLVMLMVDAGSKVALDNLKKFISAHGKITTEDENSFRYKIGAEFQHENARLRSDHERSIRAQGIIPESFMVALVSQLDAYIGRLLKALFKARPELLISSQRSLTYAQLSAFGSIEEARELLIEREIEDMLRSSHQDQFQYLENKFGLPLRKDLPAWKTFIEITQRRNLFVHCDGKISTQYLQICREHGVAHAEDLEKGTRLHVDPKYFQEAYNCIFEIGTKITQVLWRKVLPAEIREADKSLVDVSFDLNSRKEFALSAVVLDFATTTIKKHFDEEYHRILIINRAVAYKGLKQSDQMKRVLDEHDWSACSLKFRLAVATLFDRYDEAAKLMRTIGATDSDMSKAAYRDWPLFSEFRKTPQFKDAYEAIFGHPLSEEHTSIKVKTPAVATDPVANEQFKKADAPPLGSAAIEGALPDSTPKQEIKSSPNDSLQQTHVKRRTNGARGRAQR